MGYGVPAAVAAKLVHPERHRRRILRRWRVPDDRPGIGDLARRGRRPDHPPLQQRDVRHDPHAPGAPLPRPRRRHRAQKPRFRRPRPRLRRLRRHGRAHRRLRPRLRRSRRRQAAPPSSSSQIDPEIITTRTTLSAIRRRPKRGRPPKPRHEPGPLPCVRPRSGIGLAQNSPPRIFVADAGRAGATLL